MIKHVSWAVPMLMACVGTIQGVDGLDLNVDAGTYSSLDTIEVTLVNRSDAAVGYNLCFSDLQHLTADGWRSVPHLPEGTACTTELRSLPPGDEASFRHPVLGTLPAGSYRFRTAVESPLGGRRVLVTSAGFEIGGG